MENPLLELQEYENLQEALKKAKRLGIDVIVTDHHHLDESQQLPCLSLLHPSLM